MSPEDVVLDRIASPIKHDAVHRICGTCIEIGCADLVRLDEAQVELNVGRQTSVAR